MELVLWCALLTVVSCQAIPSWRTVSQLQLLEALVGLETNEVAHDDVTEEDPEVLPDLFDGDIAGMTKEESQLFRLGINFTVFPQKKWDNGLVPYQISSLYSSTEHQLIQTAINTISFMSCIKFIPWDGTTKDYILIWPVKKPSGCWSFVGKKGGQQLVSLTQPTKGNKMCLGGVGKPMHELLHALGLFHEHSRPDRDDFIDIEFNNVKKKFYRNFNKQGQFNVTTSYPYDYKSIMHYGDQYFSKHSKYTNKKTIIPKLASFKIGQRYGLSKLDCMKINDLYGCFQKSPFEKLKYQSICRFMGL